MSRSLTSFICDGISPSCAWWWVCEGVEDECVEDECVGTEVNVCLHHVCMCMCVDIRNSLQSSIDGNNYTN